MRLIGLAVVLVASLILAAEGQEVAKVYRIGFLGQGLGVYVAYALTGGARAPGSEVPDARPQR